MNQRKSRSKDKDIKQKSRTSRGKVIRYENSLLHRIIFRSDKYYVRGKESEEFNRRRFELPIQSLNQVNNMNLGFTNQVLIQRKKDSVQLFVPSYVSLKVKSIQQINIKDLVASLNCVMIIRFLISDIPEFILHHLRSRIMVQTNRGQSFFLTEKEDSTNIKMKEDSKFLSYIIRESFPVQIYQDIFLAPFQILRLSLSVTINSIIIHKAKNPENLTYTISFNSMRNPQRIPISYVSDCRLGVYDLAENLLDNYATHLATYDEVKEKFVQFVEGKPKRGNLMLDNAAQDKNSILIQADISKKINVQKVREGGLLKMKRQENREDKKKDKIDYFQYNHFIVPIYKYPGNAWATIFIPIFMLAVLSIAIFFQSGELQEKIGTIATFVLGFIALIPSIKDQLPPSQKITFAEIVVYLQALNCMLSLISHWFASKKNNVWKNPVFVLSLGIHIGCFAVASIMLILHKLSWERSYNRESNAYETTPIEDFTGWNNPHCDDAFLSYNKILEGKGKLDSQIRKYEPELEKLATSPKKQTKRQDDSIELKSKPAAQKREKKE